MFRCKIEGGNELTLVTVSPIGRNFGIFLQKFTVRNILKLTEFLWSETNGKLRKSIGIFLKPQITNLNFKLQNLQIDVIAKNFSCLKHKI